MDSLYLRTILKRPYLNDIKKRMEQSDVAGLIYGALNIVENKERKQEE
jgi:hypothetical protein